MLSWSYFASCLVNHTHLNISQVIPWLLPEHCLNNIVEATLLFILVSAILLSNDDVNRREQCCAANCEQCCPAPHEQCCPAPHEQCCAAPISNSLIIHEENTKEINTETEFGYVMKHLHKIKPTFISIIFSLNTDLLEMLYQTLGRVFHQVIQTPRSC